MQPSALSLHARLFLSCALAGGLAMASCSPTPGGGPSGCRSDMDCAPDELCVERACLPRDAGSGPSTDGGQGDGSTSAMDGATPGRDAGGEPLPTPDDVPCSLPPPTCAEVGAVCGTISNRCGSVIPCGTCPAGQVCGSGADRGRCLPRSCTGLTCGAYPAETCGPMPDGCGELTANCGGCDAPNVCGGGDTPSVCGGGLIDPDTGMPGPCVNRCLDVVDCPLGSETTIRGTVRSPNGELPIPNAIVYVPNDDIPAIPTGASCDRCEDEDLGAPLVATVTGADGSFELRDVPAGVSFPLVIKVGKWRRVLDVSPVTACSAVDVPGGNTRLPGTQGGASGLDNIPRTAVVTGTLDAMECVLLKLGIAESEFSAPGGAGRIQLFVANGGLPPGGCTTCGGISELYGAPATMQGYDMLVHDCEGNERSRSSTHRSNLRDYLNSGGRFFASHYSYDWIRRNAELDGTANWVTGFGAIGNPSPNAYVDDSFARGRVFREWLYIVDASTGGPGPAGTARVRIDDARYEAREVSYPPSRRWVYTMESSGFPVGTPASTQQYSFNTPVGAAEDAVCGRVSFSAFHVVAGTETEGAVFPSYCSGSLTRQEKILAYMLFDLATCVSDDLPTVPTCTPRTCADAGAECGAIADGCGASVNCGPCPDGQVCGGSIDAPNRCTGMCDPLTCADHDAQCGFVDDGCGGRADCGGCPPAHACEDYRCREVELH